MKRFAAFPWALLILLAFLALGATGCGTTENASARPWNSPAGWQGGGLPSTINEGH